MTPKKKAKRVGAKVPAFSKSLRLARVALGMTLRDVETATCGEISNPYLCQLEGGKITEPSPHMLWTLADCYRISYVKLMTSAGYKLVDPDRAGSLQFVRSGIRRAPRGKGKERP